MRSSKTAQPPTPSIDTKARPIPTKSGRAVYTPPRLERIGNVRDVLGKSGPTIDASPVFPLKV